MPFQHSFFKVPFTKSINLQEDNMNYIHVALACYSEKAHTSRQIEKTIRRVYNRMEDNLLRNIVHVLFSFCNYCSNVQPYKYS